MLYSFIVIPGVGTFTPERWGDNEHRNWLFGTGRSDGFGLVVFLFEYNLFSEGKFTWPQVEEEGSRLLSAIQSLRDEPDVSSLNH
jgi:hypothetical protein